MKKETTKKVTINDLSNTIDNLAAMVARGFEGVDKKFDEVNKKIDKEIGEVKENLASTRRDVLSMGDKFTMKQRPGREFANSEFMTSQVA